MSFGSKTVAAPAEDPLVTRQRQQSVLDLAKLDEEENRRIKQLRSASRGVRAFRAMKSSSDGSGSMIGDSSGGSASVGDSGGAGGGYGGVNWGRVPWGA